MLWRYLPLVGTTVFLAIGFVWRPWLQARRHGTAGILLFRSRHRGQLVRDVLTVVFFALLLGQAIAIAVEVVAAHYADESQDPGTALARSLEQANRIIVDAAAKDARYSGMGTTCTALLLRGGLAHCAHVGDSRLYLVRGNDILRMTEDHSAVMDMVKRGAISADEARHHPDKNVIVRALGARGDVEVATWQKPLALRPGDTFLMCSDGLYDVVEDNELFDAVRGAPPQLACERLVELARQRGGPDNITVGIIGLTDSAASSGLSAKA